MDDFLKNIGRASANPRYADAVTPASTPATERSWVDRMYLNRGVELMAGAPGSRGDDLEALEKMLRGGF